MKFIQGILTLIVGAALGIAAMAYHPVRDPVCGWLDNITGQTQVEQAETPSE